MTHRTRTRLDEMMVPRRPSLSSGRYRYSGFNSPWTSIVTRRSPPFLSPSAMHVAAAEHQGSRAPLEENSRRKMVLQEDLIA